MAKVKLIMTDFTAGEVSPLLSGQVNSQHYGRSCRTLKNFTVLPQGPITLRPGWRYGGKTVDSIDGVDSARKAVGIPYSIEAASGLQAYSLIFQEAAPVAGGAYTLTFSDFDGVAVSRGNYVKATASGGTPFAAANNVINRVIVPTTADYTGRFLITERVSYMVVLG